MNIQHTYIVFSEKKFSTIVSRPITIAFAMYASLNRIQKNLHIPEKSSIFAIGIDGKCMYHPYYPLF